ncbi:MAG: HAD-IIIC family phosphatase [Acidobacteriota bacterium]
MLKELGHLSPQELELLHRRMREMKKRPGAPSAAPESIPVRQRGEGAEPFPLTFAQERLWLLDQLAPGVNNIPLAVRLRGELDEGAFTAAFGDLCTRHEILRVAISAAGGRPYQRPLEPQALEVPMVELRGHSAAEQQREVAAWGRREAEELFDLAAGRLIRLRLLRLAPREHVLLLTVHHLVFDRWSVGLLLTELAAAYGARRAGAEVLFEALPAQYLDFAAWQRQRYDDAALEEQRQWWAKNLAGSVVESGVPLDFPRPASPQRQGETVAFSLSQQASEALTRLSTDEGASLFMTLLAAFHATLGLIAGRRDVVVGLSATDRGRKPLDQLIGCFTNHLPVRLNLEGDLQGRELVRRAREAVLAAFAHQQLPAERILDAVRRDEGSDRDALFSAIFRLNNQPLGELTLPGLEVELMSLMPEKANFDLDLSLEESSDGLRGLLVYRPDLFTGSTAQALVDLYTQVLGTLVEAPGARIDELSLPSVFAGIAAGRERQGEAPAEGTSPSRTTDREAAEVVVASTFTAELLEEPLAFWLHQLGYGAPGDGGSGDGGSGDSSPVRFEPYGQLFQSLLDPASSLHRPSAQAPRLAQVVLVRLADRLRDEAEAGDEALERWVDELAANLSNAPKAVAGAAGTPWIVLCCPSPETGDGGLWRRLEARLTAALSAIEGMWVVGSAELSRLYLQDPELEVHDPRADRLGHVPYTPEAFAAMATLVARRIHALVHPGTKVVTADCDNTLWGGACGELGPRGVSLSSGHRALQQRLRELSQQGVLVTLASQNVEADVVETFEARRGEFPLALESLVAHKVRWGAKSESLGELAEELDLGLDRFVFLDDNPLEIAEVKARCPEVTALRVPAAAELERFVDHLWLLDRLRVTEADRRRSGFYRDNVARHRLRSAAPSLEEFIAGLELEVEHRRPSREDLPRLAQMTRRITQFNATGLELDEAAAARWLEDEGLGAELVSVRDRFGDYGAVGAVFWRRDNESAGGAGTLRVDQLLLSCRALGRGVEHRLVARLGELAQQAGAVAVEIPFHPSSRNAPIARFLDAVAASGHRETEDGAIYRLEASRAASCRYRPADSAADAGEGISPESTGLEKAGLEKAGAVAAIDHRSSELYQRIAGEWADPRAVLAAAKEWRRQGAGAGNASSEAQGEAALPFVAPRTPIEEEIAEIWGDVLGIEEISVHHSFFKIGGHSLLGTVVLSRIQLAFDVDLPLVSLFDRPTIAGIAEAVEALLLGEMSEQERAALDDLSDEEIRDLLEAEAVLAEPVKG